MQSEQIQIQKEKKKKTTADKVMHGASAVI